MLETISGRCLCGGCTFKLTGPHNWIGNCYCESCRRATASPMTTFLGHPDGHWAWTGCQPSTFESSPGTTRSFCPTCGTPMSYASEKFPDETHFYVATLNDPDARKPTENYHADACLNWLGPIPMS